MGARSRSTAAPKAAVPLLVAALGLGVLLSAAAADTLRTYRGDSAHGNATFGVNRSSLPNSPVQVYATGNCAHCHEQHGLIGGSEPAPAGGSGPYAVFSAGLGNTDNFCFNCHGGAFQSVPNYNYTYRFGGFAGNPVTSISQAFGFEGSGGSAHTLAAIGLWAYDLQKHEDWGFVTDSTGQNATNPCLACHDVHRAMRTTVSADPSKSAIILPEAHNQSSARYRRLWGDDAGNERQDMLMTWVGGTEIVTYHSPFRYPAPSSDPMPGQGSFEPDGSAMPDGSNTPNYTEQCLACHRKKVTGVRKIRWDATILQDRSIHGLEQESHPQWGTSSGDLKPPYVRQSWDPAWTSDPKRNRNYVVGCLDCHEPHGSRLPYLLREEVNGWAGQSGTGIVVPSPGYWLDFCKACHDVASHWTPTNPDCSGCHGHQDVNELPARLF